MSKALVSQVGEQPTLAHSLDVLSIDAVLNVSSRVGDAPSKRRRMRRRRRRSRVEFRV